MKLPTITTNDIPFNIARSAHHGTSFNPEKRALQRQKDYVEHVTKVIEHFASLCKLPEQQKILEDQAPSYVEGYKKKYLEYLYAKSRVMSTMITGPANFPTARNEKANRSVDNRWSDLTAWDKRVQNAIINKILEADPNYVPEVISSDNPKALDLLKQKLATLENDHKNMKAANTVIRKHKADDARLAALESLGLSKDKAAQLLKPDFAGRVGFPSYALQNNNANIKRVRNRISQLEKAATRTTQETVKNGVRIVQNKELNRLQLFFNEKPSYDIRTLLKKNGFRWAPSQNAWQRQLTANAIASMNHLLPQLKD